MRPSRRTVIAVAIIAAMLISAPLMRWATDALGLGSVDAGPAMWLTHPSNLRDGIPAGRPLKVIIDGGGGPQTTFHWRTTGAHAKVSAGMITLGTQGRGTFRVVPAKVTAPETLLIHLSGITQPLAVRVVPR